MCCHVTASREEKLTVFMAEGDCIVEGFKVGVKFVALGIITNNVLVGSRGSTTMLTG